MKSPFKVPLEGNEREHSTEIYSVNAKILCHKMTYVREIAIENV
jgi:hypothetical protein